MLRSKTGYLPIAKASPILNSAFPFRFSGLLDHPTKDKIMSPQWNRKDERQYEHIKDSSKKRGMPVKRAKEIAARTVNKTRRQEGRTPQESTQGTGNPKTSLNDRTKDELYNKAQQLHVKGRSKMNKDELVGAIRKRQ